MRKLGGMPGAHTQYGHSTSQNLDGSVVDRLGQALNDLLAGTKKQAGRLGEAALDLDERYAAALRNNSPLEGDILGRGDNYTTRSLREAAAMEREDMSAGYPNPNYISGNLATRYGLPAAGLTMGGVALGDLINVLRGPEPLDDVDSVRIVLDQ